MGGCGQRCQYSLCSRRVCLARRGRAPEWMGCGHPFLTAHAPVHMCGVVERCSNPEVANFVHKHHTGALRDDPAGRWRTG
eukprot:gene9-biopygen6387